VGGRQSAVNGGAEWLRVGVGVCGLLLVIVYQRPSH